MDFTPTSPHAAAPQSTAPANSTHVDPPPRFARWQGWLFLSFAVVCEIGATLSLKGALTHPLLYVLVVLGYVLAFTALALVLRSGIGLGVAYGVWGAAGVVLTAVSSFLIFGEPISPLMAAGILCVIGGVVLVECGSESAHETPATGAKAEA